MDDIERLLRTPEQADLSPVARKCLVSLLCDTGQELGDPRIMTIAATLHGSPVEFAPLTDSTAEQLLVALAAENDSNISGTGSPLPRSDYALVISCLDRIAAGRGRARRELAEQIRSLVEKTST